MNPGTYSTLYGLTFNCYTIPGEEHSSLFRPTVSDEWFDEIDTWKLDSGASSFEHGRQKGRQSCTEIRVKRHFTKWRFVKQHFVYLPVLSTSKNILWVKGKWCFPCLTSMRIQHNATGMIHPRIVGLRLWLC